MPTSPLSRRDFLARSGAGAALLATGSLADGVLAPAAQASPAGHLAARALPIGIEMYAVRGEQQRDLPGTLRALKAMGYEAVEFYAPYTGWTLPFAKTVRAMMDDMGLRCHSTHNGMGSLVPGELMTKVIELNQILGARYIVLASPPFEQGTVAEYTRLAAQLTSAADVLRPHGLCAGYHNHDAEWAKVDGERRAMDIIAGGTPADLMLQLDVGTCMKAGADPVAWITAHPGRIRSAHLKDWAPGTEAQEKQYRVLFGEGISPWPRIVGALESTGGVEYYLMEQEGSRYSELDTARRCLDSWRKFRRG